MNIREDIFLILLLILFAGNQNPESFCPEERCEGLRGINSFVLIILIFFLFSGTGGVGGGVFGREARGDCCGQERCGDGCHGHRGRF